MRSSLTSPPLSTRSAPSFSNSEADLLGLHLEGSVEQILEKIRGRVVELAKSQCGSRFLQDQIREGDERYIRYYDHPNHSITQL